MQAMTGSYAYFDHTADVGMTVTANSLPELLEAACRGLSNLMIPQPDSIEVRERRTVSFKNDDPSLLLFDLLNELIYFFEVENLVFREFSIRMPSPNSLIADMGGEHFDSERHPSGNEVKAVTYHRLSVEQTADGWKAEVIFDI